MEFVFWFCCFAILYPYVVFPAVLWVGSVFAGDRERDRTPATAGAALDPFTVVVLAYNEAARIRAKIADTVGVLSAHPQSALLIVSDHSTDETVAVASAVLHPQVSVVRNEFDRGRALASNFAVRRAKNEFLVFTDVETRVPAQTILAMVDALHRERVGCVNAEIVFGTSGDEVSAAAGLYWRFELFLRTLETATGLCATASGPCMAVRRSLFRDLPPTGDVDFTTPLDVIEEGYRCLHLSGCPAYDVMPGSARAEFNARVRQVAKNFSGTLSRWGLRNILRRPLYTWALYSHKIMRWLVPFFMLGAFLSSLLLLRSHRLYDAAAILQVAFYLTAFAGWVAYRQNRPLPFAQKVYAFVLAQSAFFVGVLKALTGRIPAFYIPVRQARG